MLLCVCGEKDLLDQAEIEALFRDMESDRVERKAAYANKREEIRQAICAFANDLPHHRRPGVIFVGQTDNGACANLQITDDMLRDAGGLRGDGKILPFPVMRVSRRVIDGCDVVAIVVQPSEQPPVRVDGRTWIRVGPRRSLATIEEERRLAEKQLWHNVTFDKRSLPGATLEDIDFDRFEREYVPAATSPEIRRENGSVARGKNVRFALSDPAGRSDKRRDPAVRVRPTKFVSRCLHPIPPY